jgi:hypothetical protein
MCSKGAQEFGCIVEGGLGAWNILDIPAATVDNVRRIQNNNGLQPGTFPPRAERLCAAVYELEPAPFGRGQSFQVPFARRFAIFGQYFGRCAPLQKKHLFFDLSALGLGCIP